jgi:aspartate aminotransferase-like enzyme/GNAT superfamily N-acetyltransferase
MESQQPLKFKIANEDWEFELVHRLNYKTFVEEIPQHKPDPNQRLVDKFHSENTYIIAMDGNTLAGMIAFRSNRPFSLDHKVANLDSYLPPGRRVCEVRLLAVEKAYRTGWVFRGLAEFLAQYGLAQGYDLAVISGTTRQLKLYQHLGFKPFGPLVGEVGAQFQPMYLTLEAFLEQASAVLQDNNGSQGRTISFLPGPVSISLPVQNALGQPPISHRSDHFLLNFQIAQQLLRKMTGAREVEILLGSGTLANDVVAGQWKLEKKPGLILANGEFGERLMNHAQRMGLSFEKHQAAWGESYDLKKIRRQLEANRNLGWLWAVHCETSTGVLNNIAGLKELCAEFGLKLGLDCISTLGVLPVNLEGVYLASGVSGKGLAAFPGLSMVFHNYKPACAPDRLPRYLDLGYWAACEGVPFTHSSNLLGALLAALRRHNSRRHAELVETAAWLRAQLLDAGFQLLAPAAEASPAVFTIVLPRHIHSRRVARQMQKAGYLLSYGSEYLLRRNWIQICLMGEYSRDDLMGMLAAMRTLNRNHEPESANLKITA